MTCSVGVRSETSDKKKASLPSKNLNSSRNRSGCTGGPGQLSSGPGFDALGVRLAGWGSAMARPVKSDS